MTTNRVRRHGRTCSATVSRGRCRSSGHDARAGFDGTVDWAMPKSGKLRVHRVEISTSPASRPDAERLPGARTPALGHLAHRSRSPHANGSVRRGGGRRAFLLPGTHGDERPAVVGAAPNLVHTDDVGMARERTDGAAFTLEAVQRAPVQQAGQHLHGHMALEPRLPAPIHYREAAVADLAELFVPGDDGSDRRRAVYSSLVPPSVSRARPTKTRRTRGSPGASSRRRGRARRLPRRRRSRSAPVTPNCAGAAGATGATGIAPTEHLCRKSVRSRYRQGLKAPPPMPLPLSPPMQVALETEVVRWIPVDRPARTLSQWPCRRTPRILGGAPRSWRRLDSTAVRQSMVLM